MKIGKVGDARGMQTSPTRCATLIERGGAALHVRREQRTQRGGFVQIGSVADKIVAHARRAQARYRKLN